MVKRYETDINGNEYEAPDGSYVYWNDYDALAARLAEAERLLRLWLAAEATFEPPVNATTRFLRAADSAPVHEYGRDDAGSCPKCGHRG